MKLPSLFPISEFEHTSRGLADLLPYGTDLGDGIIGNCDGSFTAIYEMRGPDLGASAPAFRYAHHLLFARAMNGFGEGWMVHTYLGRGCVDEYPLTGQFVSRTGWLIEQERLMQFTHGAARYFNVMHIALTYLPEDEKYKKAAKLFRDPDDDEPQPGDVELEIFTERLAAFEGLCARSLRLRRLGNRTVHVDGEGTVVIDDRLGFLNHLISGNKQEVRALPDGADWSAAVAQPVRTGLRLYVGDNLISVITIDNVPETARTTLMRNLYGVDQVCDIVVRWIVRDPDIIAGEMRAQRKKLYGKRQTLTESLLKTSPFVDEHQVGAATDVNSAVSEASGGEAHGYISFGIVLRAPIERSEGKAGEKRAIAELDAAAGRVMAALRISKFIPRREVENVFDAWMATLPGMGFAQVRKGITGSRPFSYLSPLTSVWSGSVTAPCTFYPKGSSALSFVATEGTAPMSFNLHHGNVGHTLITGRTGGGKSTALAFIVAQHERYGPRSRRIILDFNRSMETLVRSMETGVHLDFESNRLQLAPFANIREPGGIERAQVFVAYILQCNGMSYEAHRGDVAMALSVMKNSKTKPSMLSLVSSGNIKTEVKRVLSRYTRGSEGAILDGEDDRFPDASTICIELENLPQDESIKKPILMALIERIEKLFDGRPTLFVMDEAWRSLNDELLAEVLREKLKTARKFNVAIVFGTQNIADFDGHPLESTLKGPDVPTKIFTNNPMARTEATAKGLRALGLEDWEIENIAGAGLGDYYITNPDGRRLFSFGLGPVTLAFVGANDKETVAEVKGMIAEDEAYMRATGCTPPRPWPARRIDKAVQGHHAATWGDRWIDGPRDDGKRIFGVSILAQHAPLGSVKRKRIAS